MEGAAIRIGNKYAQQCIYTDVVGLEATIVNSSLRKEPYYLRGKHTICRVRITSKHRFNNHHWDVHIEDCIPLSNRNQKHVLDKLD